MRVLVVLAVVLSPLRGGLLAIAAEIDLADADLAVNALVPALIAALVVGVAVRLRPTPRDLPRPLLVAVALVAVVALFDLLSQVVGLKLYAVGLAQYLVYPILAIAAWPLCEPGDMRRLTRLTVAMGVVVAVTVLIQASGIESFIQSASSEVEGLAANRYAGVTGSFLHTSSFLGVAGALTMGELLGVRSRDRAVLGSVVLAIVFSGLILTFSRSGVIIASIAALTLFFLSARGRRVPFVAMVAPAAAVALAVGAIGGVAPVAAGERVGSGFDPVNDGGNSLRAEAFGEGIDRFAAGDSREKAFGEGLGATGNGRKLVSKRPVIVESYYLKLLVETGVLGLIAIGGFLVWAAYVFARMLWRRREAWVVSIGAAGLGLSLYNVIYPVLETQILALVWWMLFAICLRIEVEQPMPDGEGEDRVILATGERAPLLVR
jgi:O-antigen ligase